MDGDACRGCVDVAQVIRCELHVGRADVLLESIQSAGARDGDDPRLLGEQPGERNLCTSRVLPRADVREEVDQCLVRLERVWREARPTGPAIARPKVVV